MMAASVLALPSGQWQPACWLTHFNYDASQRAGFAISTTASPHAALQTEQERVNHLPLVILVDAEEVLVNNAKVPWHDGWAKRKTYELVGCKVVNSACIGIRRLWFMCDMNIAKACGLRETSSKYIRHCC